jgi:hypothetical protein
VGIRTFSHVAIGVRDMELALPPSGATSWSCTVNLDLTLYQEPDTGRGGAQFLCPAVAIIDLLALDEDDSFVVIELKRGKATRDDFGQLASYVGWVQSNLAESGTATGILVSDGETPQWQEAVKLTDRIQRVDLKSLKL